MAPASGGLVRHVGAFLQGRPPNGGAESRAPQPSATWAGPSRRQRLAVALAFGLLAGMATLFTIEERFLGADFTYWWRAGRALLAGENPYATVVPMPRFPGYFVYPLPAAVVAIPFAPLPPREGAALFVACGFALAAYGLSRDGWWRLGVLISLPAFRIFENAQWTPLLLGAALVPGWGWLLACKPTLGAALFAWRPSRRTLLGVMAISLLALLWLPTWPAEWLAIVRRNPEGTQYVPPVALPGGILLLMALLRWRRPEARLVVAMACVPQTFFFYDQLPLMLVPGTQLGIVAFAVWSHLLRAIAYVTVPGSLASTWYDSVAVRTQWLAPFILWGLYAPAVAMLLRRPNEGGAPAWLERLLEAGRVPAWLRGRAPESAARR